MSTTVLRITVSRLGGNVKEGSTGWNALSKESRNEWNTRAVAFNESDVVKMSDLKAIYAPFPMEARTRL